MTLKKSALSLATAGALGITVQPALAGDTGGYGRLDVGLQLTSLEEDDPNGDDTNLDVVGLNSRFGWKGTEDLGNGVTVQYRYEFRVLADETTIEDNNRLSYVGVSGIAGDVTLGRQWSSQFNHLGTFLDPTLFVGTGYSSLFAFRQSDMIKYAGSAGAVTFEIDVRADGAGGGDGTIDEFQAHGVFDHDRVQIGAGIRTVVAATGDDTQHTGVAGSFALGEAATLRGGVIFISDNTSESGVLLGGNATIVAGGGLSFLVGADFFSDDDGDEATSFEDFTSLFGGVYKQYSKRTRVYGELRFVDDDEDDFESETVIYAAIRHDY